MTQVASARLGVGVLVRRLRERNRMSQRTLSHRVGRSPAYLSKLESGVADPSLRAFSSIAVALGMNALEIWAIIQLEAQADSEVRATELRPVGAWDGEMVTPLGENAHYGQTGT